MIGFGGPSLWRLAFIILIDPGGTAKVGLNQQRQGPSLVIEATSSCPPRGTISDANHCASRLISRSATPLTRCPRPAAAKCMRFFGKRRGFQGRETAENRGFLFPQKPLLYHAAVPMRTPASTPIKHAERCGSTGSGRKAADACSRLSGLRSCKLSCGKGPYRRGRSDRQRSRQNLHVRHAGELEPRFGSTPDEVRILFADIDKVLLRRE